MLLAGGKNRQNVPYTHKYLNRNNHKVPGACTPSFCEFLSAANEQAQRGFRLLTEPCSSFCVPATLSSAEQ